MIVKYIKGDIVKLFSEGKVIAHGCNCFHTMGAGVAGQLASKFPVILSTDKAATDYADREKLGTFSLALAINGGACLNLYTQYEPGPNIDYGALVNAFQKMDKFLSGSLFKMDVYIPRIGAGIAGGDWEKIEALINMFTPNVNIIVVDWDGE